MADIMINPCPRCGAPVQLENLGPVYQIWCTKCGHSTGICYESANIAVWNWNRQAKADREVEQPAKAKLEVGIAVGIPPSGKLTGIVERLDPDGSCLVSIRQLIRFSPQQALRLNVREV